MLSKPITLLALLATIFSMAFSFPNANPKAKQLKAREAKARGYEAMNKLKKRQSSGNFIGYIPGEFALAAGTTPQVTINLDIIYYFASNDSTFYVLDQNESPLATYTFCAADCTQDNCVLVFDDNGQFDLAVNDKALCGTSVQGDLFVLTDVEPYIALLDQNLNIVWPGNSTS